MKQPPPWEPDTSALIDPLIQAAQELGGPPIVTHNGRPVEEDEDR